MATATKGKPKKGTGSKPRKKRKRMLIPSNEVAEVIGVSRQSVLNYIRDGILTGSQQAETKRWFVTRESLEKYCQDMGTEFVD